MNKHYDVGIIIPFYEYDDEESSEDMTFPIPFVELEFKLRSEFRGIHTLMLAP